LNGNQAKTKNLSIFNDYLADGFGNIQL